MGSIKAIAEDYGGVFHDTGGMAGSWGDMACRSWAEHGAAQPMRAGQRCRGSARFQTVHGPMEHRGHQGIDYFQHIGDILWNRAVQDYFSRTLNLWHLIGKYHVPPAEMAVMNSDRNLRLCGFPWNSNKAQPDLVQRNRFWELISNLVADYPRRSPRTGFRTGGRDRFRVILDGNTTILDPEVVDEIENWVRAAASSSPITKPAGTPRWSRMRGPSPSSPAMPSPASTNSPPTETACPAAGCTSCPARKSFIATCRHAGCAKTARGFP